VYKARNALILTYNPKAIFATHEIVVVHVYSQNWDRKDGSPLHLMLSNGHRGTRSKKFRPPADLGLVTLNEPHHK
jgi:hypothetical protein